MVTDLHLKSEPCAALRQRRQNASCRLPSSSWKAEKGLRCVHVCMLVTDKVKAIKIQYSGPHCQIFFTILSPSCAVPSWILTPNTFVVVVRPNRNKEDEGARRVGCSLFFLPLVHHWFPLHCVYNIIGSIDTWTNIPIESEGEQKGSEGLHSKSAQLVDANRPTS